MELKPAPEHQNTLYKALIALLHLRYIQIVGLLAKEIESGSMHSLCQYVFFLGGGVSF